MPGVTVPLRRSESAVVALRFADIDEKRHLIVLRDVTTKSRKTRVVPISTTRLKAVVDWLRLASEIPIGDDGSSSPWPDQCPAPVQYDGDIRRWRRLDHEEPAVG